jgi:hypothetical protein
MEEQVNRRSFLQKAAIGGGWLLVFTAGGVAWRAWDRGSLGKIYEGTAFDPWEDWRNNHFKGLLGLVSAAILASNPHNSQPWLFRVDERRIEMYANMSRSLKSIDPFLREMYIGLGCALENLMVAARGRGFEPSLVLLPNGGRQSLIARIELKPGSAAEVPHYRAIGERHTNRSAYYRERDLAPAVIEAFNKQALSGNANLLLFSADDREGKLFAEGTIEATAKYIADPKLLKDSHHWFRYSLEEVNEKRDGLSVIGLGMPEWQTRVALSLPESWLGDFGRKWLDATESQHCATAPRFGVIAVRNRDDKAQLLEAGRLWQRLHLEATLQGVAMHPLNQMMEMVDHDCFEGHIGRAEYQLARIVNDSGLQAVFGFRCGYAKRPAKPAPRRGVNEVIEGV